MYTQQQDNTGPGEPVLKVQGTRVGCTRSFPFLPPSLPKIKITEKEGYIPPAAGNAPKRTTEDDIMWALRYVRNRNFAKILGLYPAIEMIEQIEVARAYFRGSDWQDIGLWRKGFSAYKLKHDVENLDGLYRGYISPQAVVVAAYLEKVRFTMLPSGTARFYPSKHRRSCADKLPSSTN